MRQVNLFLLSLCLGGIGVYFLVADSDFDPPAGADLVKISGDVDTIVIADDLADPANRFDTPLPWNSIYIKLKGGSREYRFRGGWPNYDGVYNISMISNIDIWVDPRQLDTNEPAWIYQLVERNPFHGSVSQMHVRYAEVLTRQIEVVRSHQRVGGWLLGIAVVLTLVGLIWNRNTTANSRIRSNKFENTEEVVERHNERTMRRMQQQGEGHNTP